MKIKELRTKVEKAMETSRKRYHQFKDHPNPQIVEAAQYNLGMADAYKSVLKAIDGNSVLLNISAE